MSNSGDMKSLIQKSTGIDHDPKKMILLLSNLSSDSTHNDIQLGLSER
jgi:hypothetical protein